MGKVIELNHDQVCWGFDNEGPYFRVVPGSSKYNLYGRHVKIDPTPGYSHNQGLVEKELAEIEALFPLGYDPHIYITPFDCVGRTNGSTYNDYDYGDGAPKDEHGRTYMRGFIVLFGKRIPLHPSMTRYLVAHEYGHLVEESIAHRLFKDNYPDQKLRDQYAEMRGLNRKLNFYGPRTWHLQASEVFANDFRVLICKKEAEFWPHEVKLPNEVPEIVAWWDEQMKLHTESLLSKAA